MDPLLEVNDLVVTREGKTILTVPHLAIEEGEVLAIIGPNGAGKSTLLLAVSRLLALSRGEIRFRGQVVSHEGLLAYRRRLALVLQEPLLLQNSVYENVATGLRFRGVSKAVIEQQVSEWLSRLGIQHLRDRPAKRLSGGEAQRVSLARALALQPDLLLLDEPFSALDNQTRQRLLHDLYELLRQVKMTTLFVTHDLDEALFLGSRVAIVMDGELRQAGLPEEVFTAPVDRQVANFVGVETIIPARVLEQVDGLFSADAGGLCIQAVGDCPAGHTVLLCLRPEDITLALPDGDPSSSARNRMAGRVTRLTPQGALLRVVVDGPVRLVALVTRASARELNLIEGQQVVATFKASAVHTIQKG